MHRLEELPIPHAYNQCVYEACCYCAVFTLNYGYNAVRGHRTGSNNSGAEDYLRRNTNKTKDDAQ